MRVSRHGRRPERDKCLIRANDRTPAVSHGFLGTLYTPCRYILRNNKKVKPGRGRLSSPITHRQWGPILLFHPLICSDILTHCRLWDSCESSLLRHGRRDRSHGDSQIKTRMRARPGGLGPGRRARMSDTDVGKCTDSKYRIFPSGLIDKRERARAWVRVSHPLWRVGFCSG